MPDFRHWTIEGHEVLAGRSARDNDALTFGEAHPRDWWMHVSGTPGSHVIVRCRGDAEPPRSVLEKAAAIAAWHSKARNSRGKVSVHVCRASDVRKPRGAPPGQVQLRSWEVLRVYPRDEPETPPASDSSRRSSPFGPEPA